MKAGFAMTPLIGSALYVGGSKLPSPSSSFAQHYWSYALPSYIMTGLAVLSVCLTIYPFKDFKEKEHPIIKKIEQEKERPGSLVEVDLAIDDEAVDLEHDHRASFEYKKRKSFLQNKEEAIDAKLKEFLEKSFLQCYWLLACLNFTSRGVLAIYETMSAHALLSTYNLSEVEVGYIVSVGGTIGTLNLIFFKQTWLKYFNEFQLMIGKLYALS